MNKLETTNQDLVSVIIPTYNSAGTLIRAISSAQNQTHQNIEIIVIDDGSDDDTEDILKDYIVKNLITYIHQENKGPGFARNVGIKKSSGQYIAFLDADDYWDSNKIEEQIKILKNNNYILCSTERQNIGNESSFITNGGYTFGLPAFLFSNPVTLSSVMVKRDILIKAGLFPENRKLDAVEDYDLWLRMFRYGPMYHINNAYTHYQTRRTLTRREKIFYTKKVLRVFRRAVRKNSAAYSVLFFIGYMFVWFKYLSHIVLYFLHI